MEPLPRITDVLAAKASLGTVPMALAHSLFSYTWSASYVRLVELEAAVLTTMPVVLGHALWNDPSMPEYTPEEWLPNASLQARDVAAVRQLVEFAISDMEQSSSGEEVLARLHSLRFTDASAIYELKGTPGGPRPAAPRRYGPTYQIMWQSKGRFFFLEIHNES
jgi:hypothetical protein